MKLVVADLAIVDEVRSCVLAMRLEGFPKFLPSLLVAPLDEGSITSYCVSDVLGGVDVFASFGGDDVVFRIVFVVDEPALPRVVVVEVFLV